MIDYFRFLPHLLDWRFLTIFSSVTLVATLAPARYLKPFRSVRFNIWLFLAIAVASSIGTFLPQNKPAEQALAKFGPFWAQLFQALGFFDIYHTWWFASLLGLMAFDVIACKLRRLPAGVYDHGKNTAKETMEIHLQRLSRESTTKEKFSLNSVSGTVLEKFRAWLKKNKFNVREISSSDGVVLIAGRHTLQKWGDFILHVSIVLVLTGNLMGAIFGFEEQVPVLEGGSYRMKNRPFEVTLRDFDIEYYQSTGAPSLYRSDIIVKENGRVLGEKKIVVNDPLDIHRVRFYQASWGMTDQFREARLKMAGRDFVLTPHQIVKIPGTPLSVRANLFYPTFDIDEKKRPLNADYEGKNPALQIDFLQDQKVQVGVWMLKNEPGISFKVEGPHVFPTAPPPFQLLDVDPILFSGIQVGYDPGAPLFWFGAISLLIGLSLHFYLHLRRLQIVLISKGSQTEVTIGGWSSHPPQDFERQFHDWIRDMRESL